jgi:hypothetical protein
MLLALIMLTSLDGSPVWVEANQVQIIRPAAKGANHQCREGVGAGIRIGSYAMCVRETPQQIMEKLNDTQPARR